MIFCKKIKPIVAKKHKMALNLDLNKHNGEFLKQRNVQKVGNSLLSTFGFVDLNHEAQISRAVFNFDEKLMVLVVGRGLYSYYPNPEMNRTMVKAKTDGIVSYARYRGSVVFSCTSGTYYTPDGMGAPLINSTYFPSLAVCNDRVFGVSGNQLSMTVPGDITTWDDTLTISANSQLDALVTLDKLYVLGDTCYTLTPDAQEINMKFVPFCYNIGTVQAESVVTFDKRAIFASDKGLFELKNNVITPIFHELNDYVGFDGSVACAYNGSYYVTCKRKDGDMIQNDIMLVLDVDNKNIVAVLDVNMQHISVVDGQFYAVCNYKLLAANEDNVTSCFCQTVDFNCSDVKYLDNLVVRSKKNLNVWIDNGDERRRYQIIGKNVLQKIPIVGSGRQFTVSAQTCDGLQLDYLELSAHSYEV